MILLSPAAPRKKGKCSDVFNTITGKDKSKKDKSGKKQKKKNKVGNA